MAKKEIIQADTSDYALVVQGVGGVMDLINRNYGSIDQVGQNLLGQISMPTSGGPGMYTLPGLVETYEPEFEGVVVASMTNRRYWAQEYGGDTSPPDCFSPDGITGIGNPGGVCRTCQFNEWGSKGERGKACSERINLLIVREPDTLPVRFSLPPTSLIPWRKYLALLVAEGYGIDQVVTRFTLRQAGKGAIKWHVVDPKFAGVIEEGNVSAFTEYGEAVRAIRNEAAMQPLASGDEIEVTM